MIVTLGIGLLFSLAAHKGVRGGESVFHTRHFRLAFAYLVVVGMSVAVICYLIEPDWMWMYWVDYRKLSLAVVACAFCFYPVMFCLGYLMVPELEKLRPGLAWQVYYGVNVAAMVVILVLIHRLWHVGTIEQYANGQAPGLVSLQPLRILTVGWVLGLSTPLVGASLIWLYRRISREADLLGTEQA